MSIVKALGIPPAPQGAQRLKQADSTAAQARTTARQAEFARPPAPARILPASPQPPANATPSAQPQTAARPAAQASEAARGADEAKRLFTRQTLSAYAAVLAGEESVAAYGGVSASGARGAQEGPPKPPGSLLDISA